MIDTATLPYIDLGQDVALLRKYSLENFGKKISAQCKDETVVAKFREIYKEETGTTLEDIVDDIVDDFDEDEDEFEDEFEKPAESKLAKPQPVAVTIIVQDDEKDHNPIVGSVQFRPFRIVRNVEVRVSIGILWALKNAKRTIYNPDTMEPTDVLMYPFSIVETHFE